MIIRNINDMISSSSEVVAPNGNWQSRRLITASDHMGFSLHDTIIKSGTETKLWYKNHLEAVYCISGDGSIEDLATGISHQIEPGVMYALDQNDKHILRGGSKDMRLVCVFYPALRGDEIHDKNGSYPSSNS